MTNNLPANDSLLNPGTPPAGNVLVNSNVLTWIIPTIAPQTTLTFSYLELAPTPSMNQVEPNAVSVSDDLINQAGNLSDTFANAQTTLLGNSPGAVPEPTTWAMMLLGFAGLGFAFHQSKRKRATA